MMATSASRVLETRTLVTSCETGGNGSARVRVRLKAIKKINFGWAFQMLYPNIKALP